MTTNEHFSHYQQTDTPEALNGLMAAVRRQALRHAKSKMREHAEDIAQETTIRVWQTMRSKYNPARSSFATWVGEVSASIIRDRFKAQQRRPTVLVEQPEETAVDEQPFTDYTRLHDAFSNDPELLLLLMDGHSLVHCQRVLNITRKALRCRIQKIRKAAQQGPSSTSEVV